MTSRVACLPAGDSKLFGLLLKSFNLPYARVILSHVPGRVGCHSDAHAMRKHSKLLYTVLGHNTVPSQ